jgi:hypothetical protein
MSMRECNNCESTVTTEVSFCMSTRQLRDLLTTVIISLRTNSVAMIETKLQDSVTIVEINNLNFKQNVKI